MTSLSLQLQVWYGILFRPAASPDGDCPSLPSWARSMLDSRGPAAVTKVFAKAGYKGPEELTWLCYETPEASYWAAAIGASVQRSIRSAGRVNTTYPEDVARRWADSLAQAAQILDLPAGVRFDWYQTCSYELTNPQS